MPTEVFVLAAPGRVAAHERLRATLAASDLPSSSVTWCVHPSGKSILEHWSATFLRMREAQSEFVLLLEDDAFVNRHLLHNVTSWKWKHDPKFGAGWLYSPGAYRGGNDCWFTGRGDHWYGSVGVLYRRADITALHDVAHAWMTRNAPTIDLAVSYAVKCIGRKIRQHGPPIVEHQHEVPSALGHDRSVTENWWFATTRGRFKADWRRPEHDVNRVGVR